MSNPYVSSYEEVFLNAFGRGVEQMPEEFPKVIKEITDKVMDAVINNLENYIQEDMKRNLNDQIRHEAKIVAESMLANALAGDDTTIRNLFGFNDWYMKHSYISADKPTQWNLIVAMMEKRPDIFVNERIHQQDKQIEILNNEIKRLREHVEFQRRKLEGEAA